MAIRLHLALRILEAICKQDMNSINKYTITVLLMLHFGVMSSQERSFGYDTQEELWAECAMVCTLMANIAFEISDTTEFNEITQEIVSRNGGAKYLRNILTKSHVVLNKDLSPVDSLVKELNEICDTCDLRSLITEKFVRVIKGSPEIIILMTDDLLTYNFDDKRIEVGSCDDFQVHIVTTNLLGSNVVADIGSGYNNFAIVLSALFPRLKIYANEIDEALLEYSRTRLEIYDEIISGEDIVLLKGDSVGINIDEKLDLVFLEESLHHFDYPNEMLQSIRHALSEEGILFVHETKLLTKEERVSMSEEHEKEKNITDAQEE